MTKAHLRSIILVLACLMLGLSGCAPLITAAQDLTRPHQSATLFIPPTQITPSPIPSDTSTPTLSATPSPSDTPSPTATSTETPTLTPPPPTTSPTWAWTKPGQVSLPILLYHHVAADSGWSRYYVSPENFQKQMKALRRWGYTSITPSHLAEVLTHGGELPARPVIITFDDGNLDVYTNAFPIMQRMGFVGTFYIVSGRLGAYNLVDAKQLKEMAAAGWEIGSHSTSHLDLTYNHGLVREEILQSRLRLEEEVGVPVRSFAYPFGTADDYIFEKTVDYGYTSGMGLGAFNEHSLGSLYYLSRREVQFDYDMTAFAALLPWTEAP